MNMLCTYLGPVSKFPYPNKTKKLSHHIKVAHTNAQTLRKKDLGRRVAINEIKSAFQFATINQLFE